MANLGVVTDNLVVLDIDPRHGGDESLGALEKEHGQFSLTWRALTGGGGEHIIFACPAGVEIRNVVATLMETPPLGPGIDVRARGGYIVAVPSQHISGGAYAWSVDHHPQDTLLAFAPDWLITRLGAPTTTENNTESDAPHQTDRVSALSMMKEEAKMKSRRMSGLISDQLDLPLDDGGNLPLPPAWEPVCGVCGINTAQIGESLYMVKDAVWDHVWRNIEPRARWWQILCIGCLERRLGRTLMASDFIDIIDIPENDPNNPDNSERLRDRLAATVSRRRRGRAGIVA